jgi:hypothetical protein
LQVFGNNSKTVSNIKNLTWGKNDPHTKIIVHVYIYVDSDKADLWVDVDSKQTYRYMYISYRDICSVMQ